MQGRSFADRAAPPRERIYAAKDRTGITPDRIRCVRSRDFKYVRNFVSDIPYLPTNRYTLLVEPTVAVMLTHARRTGESDYYASLSMPGRPAEEFYDLRQDPFEMNNLAHDPDYAAIIAEYRADLDRWVVDTGDQGGAAESIESIAPYGRWLDDYLGKIQRQYGLEELTGEAMYSYWMNRYDLVE